MKMNLCVYYLRHIQCRSIFQNFKLDGLHSQYCCKVDLLVKNYDHRNTSRQQMYVYVEPDTPETRSVGPVQLVWEMFRTNAWLLSIGRKTVYMSTLPFVGKTSQHWLTLTSGHEQSQWSLHDCGSRYDHACCPCSWSSTYHNIIRHVEPAPSPFETIAIIRCQRKWFVEKFTVRESVRQHVWTKRQVFIFKTYLQFLYRRWLRLQTAVTNFVAPGTWRRRPVLEFYLAVCRVLQFTVDLGGRRFHPGIKRLWVHHV